jgi:hypothetical protein
MKEKTDIDEAYSEFENRLTGMGWSTIPIHTGDIVYLLTLMKDLERRIEVLEKPLQMRDP